MLKLKVLIAEDYDEGENKFKTETADVELEHSLVAVSKWESFWKKPFLGKDHKTPDETISYIRMMIVGDEPSSEIFNNLLRDHTPAIHAYIADEMTATTVPSIPGSQGSQETITSELIYYWMVSMQIPFECQDWHLNRLFTLIRVVSFKNKPNDKKRKPNMADRRALNRQRLAANNTRG